MIALGAVAVLAIAGMAFVLMSNGNEDSNALASGVPTVSVQNDGGEEEVMVTTNVSGEDVLMSGVKVTICKMNISTDGNQTTMRVMESITLQTGEDGKVQYQFQEGEKYMICAEHQNHYGYANQNMGEVESELCYAHEWSWEKMEGQSFQYQNQTTSGSQSDMSPK
jgi:hypothetical protein